MNTDTPIHQDNVSTDPSGRIMPMSSDEVRALTRVLSGAIDTWIHERSGGDYALIPSYDMRAFTIKNTLEKMGISCSVKMKHRSIYYIEDEKEYSGMQCICLFSAPDSPAFNEFGDVNWDNTEDETWRCIFKPSRQDVERTITKVGSWLDGDYALFDELFIMSYSRSPDYWKEMDAFVEREGEAYRLGILAPASRVGVKPVRARL